MPIVNPPYKPSWVDRFIDWIDELPLLTWPWKPGAFRNFLSAVFLPMLLWIALELASRYL